MDADKPVFLPEDEPCGIIMLGNCKIHQYNTQTFGGKQLNSKYKNA